MSITAKFTSISSVPEKVVKSPSWPETAQTIEAWEQIDDLTCDFVLAGSGYHASNYMQVSWNGTVKYYFIESRSGLPGSRTRIRAVCDVLTTYSATIRSAPAVLNRTSDGGTGMTFPFLPDNRVTTLAQTEFSSNCLATNIISDTEFVYVGILQKVASVAATP